jgi:MFS family permease
MQDKNYEKLNFTESQAIEMLWTLLNCLFILGGMTGAIGSMFVLNYMGRKKALMLNNALSVVGGILALISIYVNSSECIFISRFLFGIESGKRKSKIVQLKLILNYKKIN